MAAVAPAQAPIISDPKETEEPEIGPVDESADADADADHGAEDDHMDEDEENENDDDEHENEVKEWDEGGKSHCGYGDSVHDTLMSIGSSIHKVVGEPNEGVQGTINSIGNWFQEASYAARDLQRGKMDVAEETAAAMKSVVSNDEKDEEGDNLEEAESGEADNVEEEGGEKTTGPDGAPLSPVAEASATAETAEK